MANFLGLRSLLGILGDGSATNLPPVATEELESSTDRRLRKLRYYVRANHANYAIISSKTLASGALQAPNLLDLVRLTKSCMCLC
jgi:hypothetical protein